MPPHHNPHGSWGPRGPAPAPSAIGQHPYAAQHCAPPQGPPTVDWTRAWAYGSKTNTSQWSPNSTMPGAEYRITKKGINDLPTFDGDHGKYKTWKQKLVDHASESNEAWRNFLKHIERQTEPMTYQCLASLNFGRFTGWELALDLWSFISKRLGTTLYERRVQLAYGIEGNGVELWRRLFCDYEGGDAVVQLHGRSLLQNFKPAESTQGLAAKLDDWQQLMTKYGGDIGQWTRQTMLLKILPDALRTEIIRREDLHTPEPTILWIRKQLNWSHAENLVKKSGSRSINAITESDQPKPGDCGISPPGSSPQPTAEVPSWVESLIAAVKGKGKGKGGDRNSRGSSPASRSTFPRGNCYHCNKPGHSRTPKAATGDMPARKGCPEFAKLLKDNGGKLPDTYKGAYERHREAEKKKKADAAGKSVAALLEADDSEDDSSDDESYDGPCKAIWQKVKPTSCCNPFAACAPICSDCIPTSNTFEPLDDGSNNTTTTKATDSLKSWAHRVTTTPNSKQRRTRTINIETDADVEKVGKLLCGTRQKPSAKALKRIQDDLELDGLAELIERKNVNSEHLGRTVRRVWAMIGSGSFVTIADCKKAFGPGTTVRPSAGSMFGAKYSNASGGDIVNRGETIVTHILENGDELDIPFQDADVQVPIISVKDFVRKGSVVKFKRHGGSIKLPSGTVVRFQEKHGVYFLCLLLVAPHAELDNVESPINMVLDNVEPPAPHPAKRRPRGFSRQEL